MTDPTVRDTADAMADHLVFLLNLRRDLVRRDCADLASAVYDAERKLAKHLLVLGDDTEPRGIIVR